MSTSEVSLNGQFATFYNMIRSELKHDIESAFERLDSRFDKLESRFDKLESKVDNVVDRFAKLEAK
jgi:chaperonin cofactor prefoldin